MPQESNSNNYSTLLPKRYPQHELFVCDVADAALKDIMQQMEHPFFSLSKKPDTTIRRYEHNGDWLEVTPSVKGLATIYDKDILIYCISQIMAKLNRGEAVSQRVRITARDLLIFANRGTSGPEYDALEEAIDRLAGTRIGTNIRANHIEEYGNFGLIERGKVWRQPRGPDGKKGRLIWCEVTLSDWVFNAIEANEVLTLHPDYFRLRKPVEKRIYELARKHCGLQAQWKISVAKLLKKSGSRSPEKRFKQMLKTTAETDHLPDYHIQVIDDTVVFLRRQIENFDSKPTTIRLSEDAYEQARLVAPGWDVYYLEHEWQAWLPEPPRHPESAFVGFCRRWIETRGPIP